MIIITAVRARRDLRIFFVMEDLIFLAFVLTCFHFPGGLSSECGHP